MLSASYDGDELSKSVWQRAARAERAERAERADRAERAERAEGQAQREEGRVQGRDNGDLRTP